MEATNPFFYFSAREVGKMGLKVRVHIHSLDEMIEAYQKLLSVLPTKEVRKCSMPDLTIFTGGVLFGLILAKAIREKEAVEGGAA